MIDPAGTHWRDCFLLEPGNIMIDRRWPHEEFGPYAGPCRACDGLGRLQPPDWRDAVFDTDGTLIDPGTNPDYQQLARAKGLRREEEHHA